MVKILQVLEATVGGTRRHLVSLVAGLDKSRFLVEVAAPHVRHGAVDDKSFVEEIEALGVRVHIIDMRREINMMSDLSAFLNLVKLIRTEKYDIVHVHSSKAGFLGRVSAKIFGIPTVYTPNGFYFLNEDMGRLKARFFLLVERLAGRFTDQLIAVSNSERKQAIACNLVPSNKVAVIPNAINANMFKYNQQGRKQIRSELGISFETPVIGTVARFIEQKDPVTFVYAAHQILQTRSDVQFLWCGEGPMREEIELFVETLGIKSAFHFLGYRHDIVKVMSAFDVFVLTSIFEGLPYTLLEAMCLGLPVVVTDVVGNRDIVLNGQNGWIVPPRQYKAVAEAMLDLLQDYNKRLIMGQKGSNLVKEHFDIQSMIQDTEIVYQSCLNLVSTKHVRR